MKIDNIFFFCTNYVNINKLLLINKTLNTETIISIVGGTNMKKVLLIALVCIVLITGCGESKSKDIIYTITKDKDITEELSKSEIDAICDENEVNYNENYLNKAVSFTGTVSKVDQYNNDVHIEFENGYLGVARRDYKKKTSDLKVGDELHCTATLGNCAFHWMVNLYCE